MTDKTLPLADLLAKAGDDDFLTSVAEAVVQLLMETDVDGMIGAGRHERTVERAIYRNGYRDDDSEIDVLAHLDFPAQHRTRIHSTNSLDLVLR